MVPIFNYFQAALILFSDGQLSARQVLFVALEMLESPEYELSTLANSLQDLMRRGRMAAEDAQRLSREASEAATSGVLAGHEELPPFEEISQAFTARVRQLGNTPPLEWPDENPLLDYVALVDDEHTSRRSRRKGRS